MTSWIHEEKTSRKYIVPDSIYPKWVIQNEFQKVNCPNCTKNIFCRLTHIWMHDENWKHKREEYHNNYNNDILALKHLLVTYLDNNQGVFENIVDKKWKLICNDEIIGEEII